MSQIVKNDPLVMEAVAELQRFASTPEMRELERRRKLWKLEYYSGLEVAKEKGREEERVENLLQILTKRLGEVPVTIQKKLHTIHDLIVVARKTEPR